MHNNGAVWEQVGSDVDGSAAGDNFGSSVSLNGDGAVLAVGGSNHNGAGSNAGHVRMLQCPLPSTMPSAVPSQVPSFVTHGETGIARVDSIVSHL